MISLPEYDALVGADSGVFYGLLTRRAAPIASREFEHAWQRESAYVTAIDEALADLADGRRDEPAPKPRWLDGVVTRCLRTASTSSWANGQFARVRLLERIGAITLEPDDVYVLAMVGSMGAGKVATFRDDPALVERAFWRLFEVEGGGEVSLTNVDRYNHDDWRATVLALATDGTLDRGRVLEACLDALARDFAAYRASWFTATYHAFEPTLAETADHQGRLRRLIGSDVPPAVSFAVKHLLRVQRANLLDAEPTLDALAPATLAKAKGTALDALRLARSFSTSHSHAVTRLASTALGNPNPDVQRAAAELLGTLGAESTIDQAASAMAPSIQHELGFTVTTDGGGARPAIQPLAPPPRPVPADELPERVAALLEDGSDALEFEAILAAVAVDGGQRLTPLRTRARQVVARAESFETDDASVAALVARLVLACVGEPTPAWRYRTQSAAFVGRRVEELGRTSAPLLATPDLPGGFVSAAKLVERLRRNPEPLHYDLVTALLRLHPDGRTDIDASGLPPAVRYALDRVEPSRRLGRTGPVAWWTAAERSWGPYAPEESPGLTSEIRSHTWTERGKQRTFRYTHFVLRQAGHGAGADDQPTERPAADPRHHWRAMLHGDWVATIATIWPHDAEYFLAVTGLSTLESGSATEVAHDVPRVLDALARHPGRMGTLAVHALAAGLSSGRHDVRLPAVDAFCDLVPTGRIDARDVADALAVHADAWPANRWAQSFAAISRAPGGGPAVIRLLTALLPHLTVDHRGLNKLLDLLRDETLRQGVAIADPGLRHWLGRFSGSSAAARSARRLLG